MSSASNRIGDAGEFNELSHRLPVRWTANLLYFW